VQTSISMTSSRSSASGGAAGEGSLRDRFVEAQLAGDHRGALALVERAVAEGVAPAVLRRDVVQAAQLEIGRLWQENRISVAHEHMATAISQRILVYLFDRQVPAADRGKHILVACVEGEQHELPARLLADGLELAGYQVMFLGASVPTYSLVGAVESVAPHLVALSVTMSFNVGGLRAAVAALRQQKPGVPILAGGHAISWSPGLADGLGIERAGSTMEETLATVERLVGAASPAEPQR
jgi:methanogenic corrinoid protein MtbC1